VSLVITPSIGGINPAPISVEEMRVQPEKKAIKTKAEINILRSVKNECMS
jgi:hypothetical protein